MVNNVRANANQGHDFHPLDQNFTRGEIYEFSVFPCSLHLMFDQSLSNLIVCLMISRRKTTYKSFTNELACCNGY